MLAALLSALALILGRRKPAMPLSRTPPPRPGPEPEPDDHYFELPDVTPAQRDFLLAALRSYAAGGKAAERRAMLDAIETATRIDLPLPASTVDWAAAEAEAARTGRSIADLIYDEARMEDRVWYPRRRRQP